MEAAREAEATVVTATAEMEEEDASAASPTSSSPSFLKNKVCAVCSDRALGYNFNALTCESCKAFFRRNALKNKVRIDIQRNTREERFFFLKRLFKRPQEFKCPFSDKCEVTVVTRRFCQKCRLKKCFDVGKYIVPISLTGTSTNGQIINAPSPMHFSCRDEEGMDSFGGGKAAEAPEDRGEPRQEARRSSPIQRRSSAGAGDALRGLFQP